MLLCKCVSLSTYFLINKNEMLLKKLFHLIVGPQGLLNKLSLKSGHLSKHYHPQLILEYNSNAQCLNTLRVLFDNLLTFNFQLAKKKVEHKENREIAMFLRYVSDL